MPDTDVEIWETPLIGFRLLCPICDGFHERRYRHRSIAEEAKKRHLTSKAHKKALDDFATDETIRVMEYESGLENGEQWAEDAYAYRLSHPNEA